MLEPEKFFNYYRCNHEGHIGIFEETPAPYEWTGTWSCACDDRCPDCGAEVEPYKSEELCLECGAVVDEATDGKCPQCGEPIKDFAELQKEIEDATS